MCHRHPAAVVAFEAFAFIVAAVLALELIVAYVMVVFAVAAVGLLTLGIRGVIRKGKK